MERTVASGMKKQHLRGCKEKESPPNITIKGILGLLMESIDSDDKQVISLGIGDPTVHSCFRTTVAVQEAVVDALRSAKFNGYSPTVGLPQTRKAIADYLSNDLPYELSADDVYITAGCTQAIELALSVLARPGCNILLPRPCFPIYGLCAEFRNIEVRYFDLLPDNGWEVDLHAVEELVDHNTTAMVIINPGNPCGNVYTNQHLEKIAATAKRLAIVVISDEVYGHLAFGPNPFVPMGTFGSIAPVLTLGSLWKRWLVPGWRLGWLAITTTVDTLKNAKKIGSVDSEADNAGKQQTMLEKQQTDCSSIRIAVNSVFQQANAVDLANGMEVEDMAYQNSYIKSLERKLQKLKEHNYCLELDKDELERRAEHLRSDVQRYAHYLHEAEQGNMKAQEEFEISQETVAKLIELRDTLVEKIQNAVLHGHIEHLEAVIANHEDEPEEDPEEEEEVEEDPMDLDLGEVID
ncbi:putative aminotransferase TAT2 [Primulina tabacum]|uniref:putative aminotransferase TAT2 n=1 Tax=Primulina tabacum TaxID=48773 RepID=UPI003F5950E1